MIFNHYESSVEKPTDAMQIVDSLARKMGINDVITDSYVRGYAPFGNYWLHKPVIHLLVAEKGQDPRRNPIVEITYGGFPGSQTLIGARNDESWLTVKGPVTPQMLKEVQTELGLSPFH